MISTMSSIIVALSEALEKVLLHFLWYLILPTILGTWGPRPLSSTATHLNPCDASRIGATEPSLNARYFATYLRYLPIYAQPEVHGLRLEMCIPQRWSAVWRCKGHTEYRSP